MGRSPHIVKNYKIIRVGIGLIAFAFPIVLAIGGYIGAGLRLEGSMSAYYHASPATQQESDLDVRVPHQGEMRDWFVGFLFVLGTCLVLYKGFNPKEDKALNVAGVLAIGVAIFPMAWGSYQGIEFTIVGVKLSLHGACAIVSFLCIAYVCIWLKNDTLVLIKDPDRKARYEKLYNLLGSLMIASPILAFVSMGVFRKHNSFTFFIEAWLLWVFAIYWIVKSKEISDSGADERAPNEDA